MFKALFSITHNFSAGTLHKLLLATFLSLFTIIINAQEKVTVMHEEVIGKDAAGVWNIVGDFNGLTAWHPAVNYRVVAQHKATHDYSH